MSIPKCESCGSDNVCLKDVTVMWHSTGADTGYWKIRGHGETLDCLDCDHVGEPAEEVPE